MEDIDSPSKNSLQYNHEMSWRPRSLLPSFTKLALKADSKLYWIPLSFQPSGSSPRISGALEKEMPQGPRGTLLQWRQPGTRRGWSRLVSYGGFRSHEGTPSPHPIVMDDHDVYWNNHGGLGFPNFLNPPNGDGSKVGFYLHMGIRDWSFPTDFSSLGILRNMGYIDRWPLVKHASSTQKIKLSAPLYAWNILVEC